MLEFPADAESQFHGPAFQKDKTVLLHCGSGGRAAVAFDLPALLNLLWVAHTSTTITSPDWILSVGSKRVKP